MIFKTRILASEGVKGKKDKGRVGDEENKKEPATTSGKCRG